MKTKHGSFTKSVFILWSFCTLSIATAQVESPEQMARQILNATGVQGGLIVHIGCGDGKLTAGLRAGEGYLVHGLAGTSQNLAKARRNIRDKGLYGPVSVDLLEEKTLPYIDNSVNLIVAEGAVKVSEHEIMRVLVPHGVAYLRRAGEWTKIIKPRPDNIDEWTHYLHDSSNNAVAHDTAIGPLRHLQWDGAPQ